MWPLEMTRSIHFRVGCSLQLSLSTMPICNCFKSLMRDSPIGGVFDHASIDSQGMKLLCRREAVACLKRICCRNKPHCLLCMSSQKPGTNITEWKFKAISSLVFHADGWNDICLIILRWSTMVIGSSDVAIGWGCVMSPKESCQPYVLPMSFEKMPSFYGIFLKKGKFFLAFSMMNLIKWVLFNVVNAEEWWLLEISVQ